MAERKIISAAIEPSIDDRIVKLAEKLGLSKSNLIANMLESFLPTAEELTQEDILNEEETDPNLRPTREPVAKGAARPATDDDEAADGEPEHAKDEEEEEDTIDESATGEDGSDDEEEEDGDEEEVTGEEEEEEEEEEKPPRKKKPVVKVVKLKKKKGKK